MHEPYLAALEEEADPARAEGMRAYHKVERRYLGLSNPQIDALAKEWRRALTVEARVALAAALSLACPALPRASSTSSCSRA